MAEKIPEIIGKYKILSLIAKGGMGAVYKAVHPSLKRTVILKKLTIRNNATVRERFKREAQILLDMQSPYIVHLFDYFVEGSSHYIVEEYVEGLSLAQILEKQIALPPQMALLILHDSLLALKFAHGKGIVHRDIKPGNILISKRAEIKLADFGIASSESMEELAPKNKSQTDSTITDDNLTQSGVTLGTPSYMSPEQITDSRGVDKRADIYSLGVMLYEMVTGTKPFPSSLNEETLEKIKKGKYINPRKIDKSIPFFVVKLIKKMLKGNPSKRFQNVESILVKVKKYLKKFETRSIRIALAQTVITKNQFSIPQFEEKRKKTKKVVFLISLVFMFICLVIFAWFKGFIHQTILSPWYSKVVLNMQLPSNTSIDSDLPVRAFFFVDDADEIPEVFNSRRTFSVKTEYVVKDGVKTSVNSSSARNKTYETKSVYLRNGKYRIKIAVGPYVMWRSLEVSDEDIELKIDTLKNKKRNITFKPESFDLTTGENLTSKTKFFFAYKGKWLPVEEVPFDSIKTGSILKFRVISEGYEESYYSLILDWYQDELIVNCGLEKKKSDK